MKPARKLAWASAIVIGLILAVAIGLWARPLSYFNGFTELHGWLALAYWQLGDGVHARQQLAQLEARQSGSPLAGKLRRKLATP